MSRGEIFAVVLQRAYGKPRPGLIVQTDALNSTLSTLLVCPFTTHVQPSGDFRLPIAPTSENGLAAPSWLLVDKLSLIMRGRVGLSIGRLATDQMLQVDQALALVLGLA